MKKQENLVLKDFSLTFKSIEYRKSKCISLVVIKLLFYHLFFFFYCGDRKDEISTEETLGEPDETPVFSTGKLRSPHLPAPEP